MPVAGWERETADLSCQWLWFIAVHLYNGLDVVVAMVLNLSYLARPNLAITCHPSCRCPLFSVSLLVRPSFLPMDGLVFFLSVPRELGFNGAASDQRRVLFIRCCGVACWQWG